MLAVQVLTFSSTHSVDTLQKHKWENAMTIDKYSWGFRREATLDQYLTIEKLVADLVTTVRWVWLEKSGCGHW